MYLNYFIALSCIQYDHYYNIKNQQRLAKSLFICTIIKQTFPYFIFHNHQLFSFFLQALNTILSIVKLFVGTVNCEKIFIDPSAHSPHKPTIAEHYAIISGILSALS